MTTQDSWIIEQNLRSAMRFFGQATGTGVIRPLDGAEMVYSGLDYGVFNIAFLTSQLTSRRDLAMVLANCGRAFREHKVRWSFWLCEDFLDPATLRYSRDIVLGAGLRPISHAPGMMTFAFAPPARRLPEIECRPVADAPSRAAFAELTSVCFDIPYSVARAVYQPEQAWLGDYQGFVGFAGGRAVSIVALVRAANALGIYSLATLPEFRRCGYGEALLRAAVPRFLGDGGLPQPLVLESTEAGYSLYRRLGFRDVTRFSVYLTK